MSLTYVTLSNGEEELQLSDWGIAQEDWQKKVNGKGVNEFTCTIPVASLAGADPFPYATRIVVYLGRTTSAVNPMNPTLPVIGNTDWNEGSGKQWFVGFRYTMQRVGSGASEAFVYKFIGSYQFFFDELTFEKYFLTWNGSTQIVDYTADVVLGMSLTALTGTGDTVEDTTATNLMTIAQQVKEISMFAQADSLLQKNNPGNYPYSDAIANWPTGAQFDCDQLTSDVDGNWELLASPSSNTLIADYFGAALESETSAIIASLLSFPGTAPAISGTYMLRMPLDAVKSQKCSYCLDRCLQWLSGIGWPALWMDDSQTPPQMRIAPRNEMEAVTLTLGSTVTVKNAIRRCDELIPVAIHFTYTVAGTVNNQPYSMTYHDIAAYVDVDGTPTLIEGIGQLGALYDINNPTTLLSEPSGIQAKLMALGRTRSVPVQNLDFQGSKLNIQSATITTLATNFTDPGAGGSPGAAALVFWTALFPDLANMTGVAFSSALATGSPGYQAVNAVTGAAVTLADFGYLLQKGNFYPWMTVPIADSGTIGSPTPGAAVQVTITAWFKGTRQAKSGGSTANTETSPRIEKNITVILTNMPSGTYESQPSGFIGEPVPWGLAGARLLLDSVPQYEGTIVVKESVVTDVCPIGNVVNINGPGAASEWATMNANIASITYRANGDTEIELGPNKHLSAGDFASLMRNNLGPRWYNLIPINLLNQGGSGVSADAPNAVNKSQNGTAGNDGGFKTFWANLPGDISASLPGGVHIDGPGNWNGNAPPSVSSDAPQIIVVNGSNIAVINGQKITLTNGSQSVTIDCGALPSDGAMNIQQLTFYDASCNEYTAYFLMTTPVEA